MEEWKPSDQKEDRSDHNTGELEGLLSAKDTKRLLDEHIQTLARVYEGIKI